MVEGADKIQKFVTSLIYRIVQRLQTRGNNDLVIKLILYGLHKYIIAVLKQQGITIYFCEDKVTGQIIVMAIVSGTISGSVTAWYSAGLTVLAHYGVALLNRNNSKLTNQFII